MAMYLLHFDTGLFIINLMNSCFKEPDQILTSSGTCGGVLATYTYISLTKSLRGGLVETASC